MLSRPEVVFGCVSKRIIDSVFFLLSSLSGFRSFYIYLPLYSCGYVGQWEELGTIHIFFGKKENVSTDSRDFLHTHNLYFHDVLEGIFWG